MLKLFSLKVFAVALVVSMLLSSLFLTKPTIAAPGSGAIWTTSSSCGSPQNVNHYSTGQHIFINGSGFDAGTYSWSIKGQPGNASQDPNTIVASGTVVVGANGSFCFDSYVIASDDGGEYTVDVNDGHGHGKNDNYQANLTVSTPTPAPTATPVPTPTATPDPCIQNENCATPTATPVPTTTPDPSDLCLNIDGVQTSVPDGLHIAGTNCIAFELGGPPPPSSTTNGGGQVLGASTTRGQVLGASTLGATGTANDGIALSIIAAGAAIAVISGYEIKKTL